jgi:hypothetical protein
MRPREHWSKDFVEHLRTVHFALLTISLGLILLLTSKPYDPRAAMKQLREVEHVIAQLSDPNNLQLPVQELISANSRAQVRFTDGVAGHTMARQGEKEERFIFIPKSPNRYFCDSRERFYLSTSRISEIKTVADFDALWSSFPIFIDSIKSIDADALALMRVKKETPIAIKVDGIADTPVSKDAIELELPPQPCDITTVESGMVVLAEGDHPFFSLPVSGLTRVKVQQSTFRYQRAGVRTLEESFPDLAAAATEADDDSLVGLKAKLDNDAANQQAFEAFGIKFPSEQVTRWGAVVLLGVQLYLFMYLKRLLKKLKPDDPGWDAPWMAMDSSAIARVMLFASIAVLPSVAAVLILFKAELHFAYGTSVLDVAHIFRSLPLKQKVEYVLMPLACCCSIALSVLCWTYRPRPATIDDAV